MLSLGQRSVSVDCAQDNVYVLTQAKANGFLLKPRDRSRAVQTDLPDLLTTTSLCGSQKPEQLKKPPITTQSEAAPDVMARAPNQGRHDAYLRGFPSSIRKMSSCFRISEIVGNAHGTEGVTLSLKQASWRMSHPNSYLKDE